MSWLDPSRLEGAAPHPDPPSEQLPPAVRKFGCMPSLAQLRAGDLLLVSALRQPLVSRAIVDVQRKAGFAEEHAQWHHAAVYLGNHLICEATFWGVKTASIFRYAGGTHLLRFRRDPNVDELGSCKLALEAALKLKYAYSWVSILKLLKQARSGWSHNDGRPRQLSDRATICSQLYADAYGVVTGKTLESRASVGVSPAHLSHSQRLVDVRMQWLSLSPAAAPPGSPNAAPPSR